jgi:hypothetical protein
MKPGAIAIECSTITPAWAHELGGAISNAGIAMLEAPVSGSTPQAENAQLVFLIGGRWGNAEARGAPAQGHGFQRSTCRPGECRGTGKADHKHAEKLGDLDVTAVVKLFEKNSVS